MRFLGNPKYNMFDQLESIAMTELKICFQSYKETEYYRFLHKSVMRTADKIRNIESGGGNMLFKQMRHFFGLNLGFGFNLNCVRVHAS